MTQLELIENKILDMESMVRKINTWRLKDDIVVFTNGCFDLLHYGHIDLLSKAADLGHRLVIGLNSDSSVKQIKGENRPLNDEKTRKMVLAALVAVDAVILFDEATPEKLIAELKPDVLVKGGDYNMDQIVGADIVKKNGGTIEVIPLVEGYSTTNIEAKIKSN